MTPVGGASATSTVFVSEKPPIGIGFRIDAGQRLQFVGVAFDGDDRWRRRSPTRSRTRLPASRSLAA
jgi:hypothetical protein